MIDLCFRAYQDSDLESCLGIFASNCPEFFLPTEREGFRQYLIKERLPYFVVEQGADSIVACGGFILEKGLGELAWGMVDRSRHGQGFGTFLFEQRLAKIKESGATAVIMDTSQHTLGFYQRYGFQVLKETPHGYGPRLHRYDLKLSFQPY